MVHDTSDNGSKTRAASAVLKMEGQEWAVHAEAAKCSTVLLLVMNLAVAVAAQLNLSHNSCSRQCQRQPFDYLTCSRYSVSLCEPGGCLLLLGALQES